jgi:antitoxin CptB
MRELDLLLVRYLETHYATASAAEQQSFERLLALTDPELVGYLLRGDPPADQDLTHVIERVRNPGS